MNRNLTAAVIAVALLTGCGGGDNDNGKTGSAQTQTSRTQTQGTTTTERRGESGASGATGRQPPGRKKPTPIASQDRHALRQIGIAISAIRRAAGSGSARRWADLETLLPQIGALQPQDPRLIRLRALTVKTLGDAIRVAGRPKPLQRDRAALAAELSLLRQGYSSVAP